MVILAVTEERTTVTKGDDYLQDDYPSVGYLYCQFDHSPNSPAKSGRTRPYECTYLDQGNHYVFQHALGVSFRGVASFRGVLSKRRRHNDMDKSDTIWSYTTRSDWSWAKYNNTQAHNPLPGPEALNE